MFLHEAFPRELITIGLKANDKDEAFRELIGKFCEAQKPTTHNDTVQNKAICENLLSDLWERESKMSTGIQKGIAIPHARSSCVDGVHGVLGISKKGIDYDALDGQPVYLIFMLLLPKEESFETHLRLLKRVSKLLDNHRFYADLLSQNDPESVNRIIKKYEDTEQAVQQ